MTATAKQIVCVKWGTKYGPDYVNRLYAMVKRNITGPFRFVCLTDSREGLRPEVECFDLPELGCAHPVGTFGKWKKVVLWGKEVPGLGARGSTPLAAPEALPAAGAVDCRALARLNSCAVSGRPACARP